MDVKIKRLALGIAAIAIAAALLASGTYAAPVTPDDSWIAAEDWEDTKDDEPETTAAPATTPPPGDEQIVISGKKTWYHGANPAVKRPDSITVIIKADGAIVTQRLITAADHWAWSFMLPKYGRDGKEIVYTVNEARFENYVKTVDGYNLINTYMPGHNTDEPWPPGASLPKTDDNSNLAFWLAFMGASLFGLAFVIIILRRKRREENRS
jgi:LPXTG-motif cell wall-anchored protein